MKNDTSNVTQPFRLGVAGYVHTATVSLVLLLACWIVVSNALIMAAPRVHRPLRRHAFLLVTSLAAADLLTALFMPAAWIMAVIDAFMPPDPRRDVTSSRSFCMVVQFFFICPMLASVLNLLLIAVDRYVAVVHPMRYRLLLPRRRIYTLIALAWCVSFAVACVHFVWHRTPKDGKYQCNGRDMKPMYIYICIVLPFIIIASTMTVLYLRIFLSIRRSERSGIRTAQSQSTRRRSDVSAAKMLGITMGVFLFCWSPLLVTLLLFVADKVGITTLLLPHILAYANSGMNFFIYAARSKEYQRAFSKICRCCCCCRKNNAGQTSSGPVVQQLQTSTSRSGAMEN